MNKKRVFILGAGFSKQVGMPLATELTEPLLKRFKESNHKEMIDWYRWLEQRINWMGDNRINIEQVFDLAKYDIMAWRMKQQQESVRRNTSEALIKTEEINDWLHWMERDLGSVIWSKQKETRSKLEQITKFSQNLQIDDVVLTFNYDTLLEESLTEQLKSWHYGFELENRQGIKILKMHGSINWKIANKGETNSSNGLLFRKKGNLNVTNYGMQELNEHGNKHELARVHDSKVNEFIIKDSLVWDVICRVGIAGLGVHKPLDILPGSWEVWSNAMKALEEAEEIYVIGFSLSPFDSMARLHFAGVMLERAKKENPPKKIILIDPEACSLKQSFQSVFGTDTPITTYQQKAEQVKWYQLLK